MVRPKNHALSKSLGLRWDRRYRSCTTPAECGCRRVLRETRAVELLYQNKSAQVTWANSYTKLLAFNLMEFDRVLAIDSESAVLQNLDELFLLPASPLVLPYIY
jgi:hypothetical protein